MHSLREMRVYAALELLRVMACLPVSDVILILSTFCFFRFCFLTHIAKQRFDLIVSGFLLVDALLILEPFQDSLLIVVFIA